MTNEIEALLKRADNWLRTHANRLGAHGSIDMIRDLASALRAKWRPIESAPVETVVLVGGSDYVTQARKHLNVRGEYDWKTPGGGYFMHDPTHWMPLPSPPAADTKEKP